MKIKKKILVVGGTGFIGYHLSKHCLKKGWKVTSFSKNQPKEIRKLKLVNYIEGDLFFKKDLKKIKGNFDYVVNLGGYVDHLNKIRTHNSHYIGCKNLSIYFRKKKIKAFVQMGSSGEYGISNSPQKEIMTCNPQAIYSKSKFLATKHLVDEYKKYDFPMTVLRLYQAYGEKQDTNRLIPIVINSCIDGKNFDCSDGKQYRDFLHVSDVVSAIIKSLESKKTKGQIFNLGSGVPINVKFIINFIKKKIGKGQPKFGKLKLRKEESLKIYPDISKIKKTINWTPKVNFNQGIKRTIKFYVKEKEKKSFPLTAVIPVRKNSQRVKNKNLKKFYKKSLLHYKIEQLKRIKLIDNIIVNTDSERAIKMAKKLKVNFFKRDKFYASSFCKNSDFWKYIAETTYSKNILFINCTSPLVKDRTIIKIIKLFNKNNFRYDSINSATNEKQFLYKNNKALNFNPSKAPNSQNLPNILKLNFGINILSRENMIKNKSIIGKKPYLYQLDDIEGIDIDTSLEFEFAELAFKKNIKNIKIR